MSYRNIMRTTNMNHICNHKCSRSHVKRSKKTGEINFNYIKNIQCIISTFNHFLKLLIRSFHFFPSHYISKIQHIFYPYSESECGPVAMHALESHMWLVLPYWAAQHKPTLWALCSDHLGMITEKIFILLTFW